MEIARAFQVGCGRMWNSFVECQILGRGGSRTGTQSPHSDLSTPSKHVERCKN